VLPQHILLGEARDEVFEFIPELRELVGLVTETLNELQEGSRRGLNGASVVLRTQTRGQHHFPLELNLADR
jgi:hypothetical protein